MKKIRQLSEQEVMNLQKKIVDEHWIYLKECWSMHAYETWWVIDGIGYEMYQAITLKDVLPLVWEVCQYE